MVDGVCKVEDLRAYLTLEENLIFISSLRSNFFIFLSHRAIGKIHATFNHKICLCDFHISVLQPEDLLTGLSKMLAPSLAQSELKFFCHILEP